MIAANPNRKLGVLWVVNLHRRTWGVARTTADALLLIHLKRWLSIDLCRSNGRYGAAGHNRGSLTNISNEVMIDLWRFGVLNIYRNITLSAAINLTA